MALFALIALGIEKLGAKRLALERKVSHPSFLPSFLPYPLLRPCFGDNLGSDASI